MNVVNISWTLVESKSALNVTIEGNRVVGHLETTDANTWGFFHLPFGRVFTVGYANLGLRPIAVFYGGYLFVGIDELLAGYNAGDLKQKFVYRMPSVFHEFVSFAEQLIIRDEIGFIGISLDGTEKWKRLFHAPIDKFKIEEYSINGCTIDGENFSIPLPA